MFLFQISLLLSSLALLCYGTGADVKISKPQIRKAVQEGGSLWSSLFSLGARILPYATSAASKAIPAVASGTLCGLANMGVNKIFGKGQVGGFMIPQNKVNQLIQYKDWLADAQKKKQIVSTLHSAGQVIIKPTKAQSGGFLQLSSHLVGTLGSPSHFTYVCAGYSPPLNVESNRSWCWQSLLSTLGGGTATSVPTNVTTIVGTLLASIGVPLLMSALTRKGLQVVKRRPRR